MTNTANNHSENTLTLGSYLNLIGKSVPLERRNELINQCREAVEKDGHMILSGKQTKDLNALKRIKTTLGEERNLKLVLYGVALGVLVEKTTSVKERREQAAEFLKTVNQTTEDGK